MHYDRFTDEARKARFTDEARKAMALANREAIRFNHEYLGPEHLLLGIIKLGKRLLPEEKPGAYAILENVSDPTKIKLETEKRMKSGPSDMVTMGKLPHTSELKGTIERAIEFARKYNLKEIGTESLLYGIFEETKDVGIAQEVLEVMGIKGSLLEREILIYHDQVIQQEPRTEEQPQTPKYWLIPRSLATLTGLIEKLGYKKTSDGYISGNRTTDIIGRQEPNGGTIVHYDPSNLGQIRQALELKDLLNANQIPFTEKPPAQEVKKSLTELLQILEQ